MSATSLDPFGITTDMLAEAFPALTARECEVLRWIIQCKHDPQIAVILEISPATVSRHVHNLLLKLCVEDRAAAAMEAVSVIICHRPPAGR